MKTIEEILIYFPNKLYQIFSNLFQENPKALNDLQEIRLRADRPIILKLREKDLILQYNISQSELFQDPMPVRQGWIFHLQALDYNLRLYQSHILLRLSRILSHLRDPV